MAHARLYIVAASANRPLIAYSSWRERVCVCISIYVYAYVLPRRRLFAVGVVGYGVFRSANLPGRSPRVGISAWLAGYFQRIGGGGGGGGGGQDVKKGCGGCTKTRYVSLCRLIM